MTETFTRIRHMPFDRPPTVARDEHNDLRELWLAMRRQFWVVTLCATLGVMIGIFHYVTSPREYRASATVLIEDRQRDLAQEITTMRPLERNDTAFENELQILGSLHLAAKVVRDLGLDDNPAFLSPPSSWLGGAKAALAARIRGWLPKTPPDSAARPMTEDEIAEARIQDAAVKLVHGTELTRLGKSYSVAISYGSHDPALSAAIANAYAAAYLADGLQVSHEASARTGAWMQDRLDELRLSALAASEEAQAFRAETGARDQQGLREHQQKVEALNELYIAVQARYQQLFLEGSYPVVNGRLLSQALVPKRPSGRAWMPLAAGLALGLLMGLGVGVLRELRETGFRTGGDVREAAGLPFLGYLPELGRHDRRLVRASTGSLPDAADAALPTAFSSRRRSVRPVSEPRERAQVAHLAQAGLPEQLEERPSAPTRRETAFVNAVRDVLASLVLDLGDRPSPVIAVGGIVGDEGATTAAANLANLASLSGQRVLIMDADFASSAISAAFDVTDAPGILGVLSGAVSLDDALCQCPGSGLTVLPTGAAQPVALGPAHVIRLGEILAELKSRFDVVFVDLPPLGAQSIAKDLVDKVDRLVLVTRWGRTPRRLVAGYLEHEPEIRKRMAGAVLARTNLGKIRKYGEPLRGQRGHISLAPI